MSSSLQARHLALVLHVKKDGLEGGRSVDAFHATQMLGEVFLF